MRIIIVDSNDYLGSDNAKDQINSELDKALQECKDNNTKFYLCSTTSEQIFDEDLKAADSDDEKSAETTSMSDLTKTRPNDLFTTGGFISFKKRESIKIVTEDNSDNEIELDQEHTQEKEDRVRYETNDLNKVIEKNPEIDEITIISANPDLLHDVKTAVGKYNQERAGRGISGAKEIEFKSIHSTPEFNTADYLQKITGSNNITSPTSDQSSDEGQGSSIKIVPQTKDDLIQMIKEIAKEIEGGYIYATLTFGTANRFFNGATKKARLLYEIAEAIDEDKDIDDVFTLCNKHYTLYRKDTILPLHYVEHKNITLTDIAAMHRHPLLDRMLNRINQRTSTQVKLGLS